MKAITGLVALFLIGVVATATVSAFGGFRGNDDIQQALENNDYEAWTTLMNERHAAMMTEEGFAQMQERYQNRGEGHGMDAEFRAAIDEAIANNDYDAWVALHEEKGMPVMVEEGDFDTLVQMHKARQAGEYDLADQLREDLGLPERGMGSIHGGRGHNGMGHGGAGRSGNGLRDGSCGA